MSIPILWQHNQAKVVGQMDGNIATFEPGTVTAETMLHAGWRTLESETVDGTTYILKAEIVELSVGPD